MTNDIINRTVKSGMIRGRSNGMIAAGLILSTFLITVLVLDHVLGLLGFPAEFEEPVVHPPNYTEFRDYLDFQYTFQTNSQGLRYREIPLEKPDNAYRVFVVGDSFTEGIGMETDQTLPSLLELEFSSAVQDVSFINGGLAGTGPVQYGRVLFDVGQRYQPDAVLIDYYANDLGNIGPEAKPEDLFADAVPQKTGVEEKIHFLIPRTYTMVNSIWMRSARNQRRFTTDFISTIVAEARLRGVPEARINAWKARIPKNLVYAVEQGRFFGAPLAYGLLSPNYYADALDITSDEAEARWEALDSVLEAMVSHSRDLGLEVAIVYIPERLQYDAEQHTPDNIWYQAGLNVSREWLTRDTEIQNRLREWSSAHEVSYLDLTPILREAVTNSDVSLTWQHDNHFNAAGNLVVAQAIAEWIKSEGVFDIQ